MEMLYCIEMNTTSKASRCKTVLIAIFTVGMTGWQKRNGVFRYIGEGRPWNVQIAATKEEFKAAWSRRKNIDGLLVSAPNIDADMCGFANTSIPTVLFNLNIPTSSPIFSRKTGVVFLHHDSSSIGDMAARHLLSAGMLNSFVFLAPGNAASWANEREKAFAAALSKCNFQHTRLEAAQDNDKSLEILRSLEKPIGMFAASDRIALNAITLAREARLHVPDDIAILGVDNDESICESTAPTLSSIATSPETLGYTAAQLLDQLMAKPMRASRNVTLKCKLEISLRESTFGETPHGPLVEKACAYIDAHATDGIGPNDVAKHLGISRRLLDLRFSQVRHKSVLSIIQDAKLRNVQKQLLSTSSSIEKITHDCGYNSPNHLKKVFKTRLGMSMRDYRSKAKSGSTRA